MNVRAIHHNGIVVRFEGIREDITERNSLREKLVQAQKLESVGQLAAGIAMKSARQLSTSATTCAF